MKLISVISNYQLLEAIVYKINKLKNDDVVLLIGETLLWKYPNYQDLTKYFKDVIPFEISVPYNGTKLENTYYYFDDLLKEYGYDFSKFDEIYCAAAHLRFGVFLALNNIEFIYMEDGAGMLSKFQHLYKIEYDRHPSKTTEIEKLGLFSGKNKLINRVIADMSRQLDSIDKSYNVEDFSISKALKQLETKDIDIILKVFNIKNKTVIKDNTCIIFSENFTGLTIFSYEYQCKSYQFLIDYFFAKNSIVLKPHPDDITYYSLLFPNAYIMRDKFPSELLPYVITDKPKILAAYSSTSVHNLNYMGSDVFSFDEQIRNENIIDSFHKYYIVTLLLNQINKQFKIYIKNVYKLLLDNMNIYTHCSKDENIYVDNVEYADVIIIDNLIDIETKIDINNAKYVIFLDNPYKLYKHEISNNKLSIIKISKKAFRQDFVYDNLEDEYLYVYTNNNLEDINIMEEKKLENSGIDLKVETLTDEKLKIAILEGILKATEERLITELTKEKIENNG